MPSRPHAHLPAAPRAAALPDLAQAGRQLIRERAFALGPATGKGPADLAMGEAYIDAMSPRTQRAYRLGWRVFSDWCDAEGVPLDFPAHAVTPEALAMFVEALGARGMKPATVAAYVAAVARYHAQLDIPSPAGSQRVKDAKAILRKAAMEAGEAEQDQATPMRWQSIGPALDALGDSPRDVRDRALILMAYETGARAGELCALRWKDVREVERGAVVTIRSTKTGDTRECPLPPGSYAALRAWVDLQGLDPADPIFAPLSPKSQADGLSLSRRDVARIYLERVGPFVKDGKPLSAHSPRVGKAQDLRAAGFSTGDIAQAMGWKTDAMPNRYTRHLAAWDNASARLAQMQGRA